MKENMWNPWHGCHKLSLGCEHCFVYYIDDKHNVDAGVIRRSKTNFKYPLAKDRHGNYKIKSGTQVATCFTSDFFLEEADEWRQDAWDIIKSRPDVEFLIPTKRINRFENCLPSDWGRGYDNVFVCVSVENQTAVDLRLPFLLAVPIRKKGVFLSPLLERVNIEKYLASGEIALVSVGGESYKDARECNFDWIVNVKNQCERHRVPFDFHQTGSNFVYNEKRYHIPHHQEYSQAKKAFKREKRS